MIAYLSSLHPLLLLLPPALIYLFFAAGRWTWPMLCDAGLGALYLWRPSLALLVFVCGLVVIRWTPALAREVAVIFQLVTFDGWTRRVVLFALPALGGCIADGKTIALSHMSSAPARPALAPDTDAVHVPVPRTGTNHDEWEAPRISTRLSDAEEIALLAAQRGKDGKYKHSANAIFALVGGSRADVLAQVKAIRESTPVVYPPLSPEQHQARDELGLG